MYTILQHFGPLLKPTEANKQIIIAKFLHLHENFELLTIVIKLEGRMFTETHRNFRNICEGDDFQKFYRKFSYLHCK